MKGDGEREKKKRHPSTVTRPPNKGNIMKNLCASMIIGITIALLALSAAPGYAAYETSMQAYWKFDEGGGSVANDSAGENDATLYGSPTWQAPPQQKLGGALYFDGSNDIGVTAAFNTTPFTNQYTVSVWVNHGWTAVRNPSFLSTQGPPSGGNGFEIYEDPVSDIYKLIVKDNYAWAHTYVTSSTGFVSDYGVWVHLVGVYDGSTLKLYRNGSVIGSSWGGGNIQFSTSAPFVIGNQYIGYLDDLAVWSRALSEPEITGIYTAGQAGESLEGLMGGGDEVPEPATVVGVLGVIIVIGFRRIRRK